MTPARHGCRRPWQSTFARFADVAHRRRVAAFCLVTAAFLPPAGYLAGRYRLALDPQTIRCLPELRAVLIDRQGQPHRQGDLLVFEARGLAPAFADGTLLVKRLVALPGDRVAVSPEGVRVNGALRAQGLALASRLGHAPADFTRSYRMPAGHFLALGSHPLSLDGRYYGPLPDTLRRGSATILF